MIMSTKPTFLRPQTIQHNPGSGTTVRAYNLLVTLINLVGAGLPALLQYCAGFYNQVVAIKATMAAAVPPAAATRSHAALTRLAASGQLVCCYSQNVNGLDAHTLSPTALPGLTQLDPPPAVPLPAPPGLPILVQVHGNVHFVRCNRCNHVGSTNPAITAT